MNTINYGISLFSKLQLSLHTSFALPIGISFFTFQGISYLVDIYRKQQKHKVLLLDFFLYIGFFPQLIAGPIMRANEFIPQIQKKPVYDNIYFVDGTVFLIKGIFKKVVIASSLLPFVDQLYLDPTFYTGLDLLAGIYGYMIIIYCDFSAYSDMAIGLSLLLGYRLVPNFSSPYLAYSIRDFWRRWHMSLSRYIRDYLYIPLGGNSKNVSINLIITMSLVGLWHGSSWTFILWGTFHGIIMALERAITYAIQPKKWMVFLYKPIGFLLTFHIIGLTWVLFRAGSLEQAYIYLLAMCKGSWSHFSFINYYFWILVFLGFIPQWLSFLNIERFCINCLSRIPVLLHGLLLALFFAFLQIVTTNNIAPFIYYKF